MRTLSALALSLRQQIDGGVDQFVPGGFTLHPAITVLYRIRPITPLQRKGSVDDELLLEGAHAPLGQGIHLTHLDVVGEVPDYLDGRYPRTGPNPIGD